MDKRIKWFLEMESTGEDSVKIVEITSGIQNVTLTYLIKQWQDLRGLTPILKEVLPWIKCYQTALHAAEKSFVKKKQSIDKTDFIVAVF